MGALKMAKSTYGFGKPKKWSVETYLNFLTKRILKKENLISNYPPVIKGTELEGQYTANCEKLHVLETEFKSYNDPIEKKRKTEEAQLKRKATIAAKKLKEEQDRLDTIQIELETSTQKIMDEKAKEEKKQALIDALKELDKE